MSSFIIRGAKVVNEGKISQLDVLVKDQIIQRISEPGTIQDAQADSTIDATGLHLFPGLIDDQVHFREPGLTHKAEIKTESRAAVAGGVTSFMEMPNTVPQALTQELLQDKYDRAEEVSAANFSFFMGASNDNLEEVLKTDGKRVCGVKVFMGSSTGNMLVDNRDTLERLFAECPLLIATHCEDEATVKANEASYRIKYGEDVPIRCHPEIRSEDACYKSSSMAVELARKHNTRLHILHISTARETELFQNDVPLEEKRITAEACIHHLFFNDTFYDTKGTLIKWNPAVKKESDRKAVLQAVLDNRIDVIATDHAPHTRQEKDNTYFKAPSGGPLVQHSLVALLELYHRGEISLEQIADKTSHSVARLFQIEKRGFIREGYFADLVLADLDSAWEVTEENVLAKCGWSPFEGYSFKSEVKKTWVNGQLAFSEGRVDESIRGMRMTFDRK